MRERIEKIMKNYFRMVMERKCLENQIKSFTGITEDEMIDSMHFSRQEGGGVQISGVSDKTAHIAISYREKTDRVNRDWLEHLEKKHSIILEELAFFEAALFSLSGILPEFISDMVIKGLTWDDLADKYHVSRTMVAKYRRKAIRELEILYRIHDKDLAEYLLS